MRTLASKMKDVATDRYVDIPTDLDPTIKKHAEKMLASAGGAKVAKVAIAEMLKQAEKLGHGWLPTARISAPMRILVALETLGVAERANDNDERQTVAIRFRLTERALDMAIANSRKA